MTNKLAKILTPDWKLPSDLQQLIELIEAEAVKYEDRASDVQQFEASIANGDHRMGVYQAKRIIERQQQLRNAQQNGLPAELQHLIVQMNTEAVEYEDRARDVQQFEASIANGDHRMGVYHAKKIVERQQQLRNAQQNGLPAELQHLIVQMNTEAAEYVDRARDVQQFEASIANGDHRMGVYQAKRIIERQEQFRDAQENGLPAELQHLITQIKHETVEYPERAYDLQQLDTSLAKGDHRMGVHHANKIIERQANVRERYSQNS